MIIFCSKLQVSLLFIQPLLHMYSSSLCLCSKSVFQLYNSSVFPQIPLEAFRRPGPTRIPKPKGFSSQKATNTGLQNKSHSGKEQPTHTPASVHNNNPHLMNRRLWYEWKLSNRLNLFFFFLVFWGRRWAHFKYSHSYFR